MHDHLGLRKRLSNALRFGCWFDFGLTALFPKSRKRATFGFRFGGKMNEDYGNDRLKMNKDYGNNRQNPKS